MMYGHKSRELTDPERDMLNLWCKLRRDEGKVFTHREVEALVGRVLPKVEFLEVIRLGIIRREAAPVGGIYAYWLSTDWEDQGQDLH